MQNFMIQFEPGVAVEVQGLHFRGQRVNCATQVIPATRESITPADQEVKLTYL